MRLTLLSFLSSCSVFFVCMHVLCRIFCRHIFIFTLPFPLCGKNSFYLFLNVRYILKDCSMAPHGLNGSDNWMLWASPLEGFFATLIHMFTLVHSSVQPMHSFSPAFRSSFGGGVADLLSSSCSSLSRLCLTAWQGRRVFSFPKGQVVGCRWTSTSETFPGSLPHQLLIAIHTHCNTVAHLKCTWPANFDEDDSS